MESGKGWEGGVGEGGGREASRRIWANPQRSECKSKLHWGIAWQNPLKNPERISKNPAKQSNKSLSLAREDRAGRLCLPLSIHNNNNKKKMIIIKIQHERKVENRKKEKTQAKEILTRLLSVLSTQLLPLPQLRWRRQRRQRRGSGDGGGAAAAPVDASWLLSESPICC